MKKIYALRLVLFLFLFTFNCAVSAQELSKERKADVVEKISTLLKDKYVFPDIAEKCSEYIKSRLNSGAFDAVTDKEKFAVILTQELQSISKDKHMRVMVDKQSIPQGSDDPFYRELMFRQQVKENNLGFAKVEFMEGGIGYLDLRGFAPLNMSKELAEAAMKILANSDALIIDLRKNGGGSPDLISFISSYLFNEPTHLNSLYWREGDRTEEFWTSRMENSTLTEVPVFVLTSSRTFSGGEEFANNLKTQKRATIIGETTGGGANPGSMFRIADDLAIFIPTGTAINPVTKTNWEGTGVEPDIKTSSDEAYNIALNEAKTAAEEYRRMNNEKALALSGTIRSRLNDAEEIITSDQVKAERIIADVLDEAINSGLFDESSINMAGYNYLEQNKLNMAIGIFKYNVKKFPGSANTYDSLAEAYMKNNQKELSIKYYKKSLELNPENNNAEEMIKKMSN
jgi:tetratricopeptide (TPR) repeat protein